MNPLEALAEICSEITSFTETNDVRADAAHTGSRGQGNSTPIYLDVAVAHASHAEKGAL